MSDREIYSVKLTGLDFECQPLEQQRGYNDIQETNRQNLLTHAKDSYHPNVVERFKESLYAAKVAYDAQPREETSQNNELLSFVEFLSLLQKLKRTGIFVNLAWEDEEQAQFKECGVINAQMLQTLGGKVYYVGSVQFMIQEIAGASVLEQNVGLRQTQEISKNLLDEMNAGLAYYMSLEANYDIASPIPQFEQQDPETLDYTEMERYERENPFPVSYDDKIPNGVVVYSSDFGDNEYEEASA